MDGYATAKRPFMHTSFTFPFSAAAHIINAAAESNFCLNAQKLERESHPWSAQSLINDQWLKGRTKDTISLVRALHTVVHFVHWARTKKLTAVFFFLFSWPQINISVATKEKRK